MSFERDVTMFDSFTALNPFALTQQQQQPQSPTHSSNSTATLTPQQPQSPLSINSVYSTTQITKQDLLNEVSTMMTTFGKSVPVEVLKQLQDLPELIDESVVKFFRSCFMLLQISNTTPKKENKEKIPKQMISWIDIFIQEIEQNYRSITEQSTVPDVIEPAKDEDLTIDRINNYYQKMGHVKSKVMTVPLIVCYQLGNAFHRLQEKGIKPIQIAERISREEKYIERYIIFYKLVEEFPGILYSSQPMTQIVTNKQKIISAAQMSDVKTKLSLNMIDFTLRVEVKM